LIGLVEIYVLDLSQNNGECENELCYQGVCVPGCDDNSPVDECGSDECGSIGKCIGGSCYEYPVSDEKRCTDQGLVYQQMEEVCLYPCTLGITLTSTYNS